MMRNSTVVQNSVKYSMLLENEKWHIFIISIILILSGPVAMAIHHK